MPRQRRPRAPAGDPAAPDPARLRLEPRLDLGAASALVEGLLAARGRDLALDAAEVRFLGGPGLQVLLAARRSWADGGRALSVEDPSEAFLEGLARLGATIDVITVERAT